MFAVALKADPAATYVLSDTDTARLEIVPDRGGIATRWQVEGQDIFYFDRDRFANPELSVRGGIPILFPICGNLPDNQYHLDGQAYRLKQHGFARDLPWQATQQDVSEAASLTLELSSDEATLAHYPFEFKLAFTFQLKGHTLDIGQRFTNLSDQSMPFSTGLHPYFLVEDKSQLEFEIPSTEYRNHLTGSTEPFGGSFDMTQDEIDLAFQGLTAPAATVTDHHLGRRLTLSWSADYTKLVFWTVKGKDYYCLEPWTAPRNALNTGENLLVVEPQQTMTTHVRMAVAFLR
ncbi:aldose epimerase [Nodosilinea sp. LEGE 07088]|uniref:aldose epimerase family protein n=1 Tax=Nodosilinea sp. LEGE 07088 TaxID=2777968 RepID=UPI001882E523|nr:aldose epimerase [Nodosilinea sp. LEGE 07088]MBE9139250.1 aldose epimerase [Nodosilinea sp. LEGE 07088]